MSRLSHKRGRKSNYTKSLNNSYHKAAKHKALFRDKYACKLCGVKIGLEFHHVSYHVRHEELEGDNLKWTAILCGEHHQAVHDDLNHPWNPKNKDKKDIYGERQ